MNAKDFKEFLNLKLVDIAEGITGESISFIFEVEKDGHTFLKGFRIYPKNVKSCVIGRIADTRRFICGTKPVSSSPKVLNT